MSREPVVVALVNNMPDSALQSTELQFRELLGAAAAASGREVELRLFSFAELIRGDVGRAYVAEHYERIERLWEGAGDFDGLIVTGAEPRTRVLPAEVYWQSLTRLVDWADEMGIPTIWSCLAAHAAVFHLSGIERRPYPKKLSGLFTCSKAGDHPMVAGMPMSWSLPHSRLNTLDPSRLVAGGYEILSASSEAGADTFIRRGRALFVFYQGHPEYDAGALLREYRRDVARFLTGTMDDYPDMPRDYFDEESVEAFLAFRERAVGERNRTLLDDFPRRSSPSHVWREPAVQLYSNWLDRVVSPRPELGLRISGEAIALRAL